MKHNTTELQTPEKNQTPVVKLTNVKLYQLAEQYAENVNSAKHYENHRTPKFNHSLKHSAENEYYHDYLIEI